MFRIPTPLRLLSLVVTAAFAAALTGCQALNPTLPASGTAPQTGGTLTGVVHGGQQPVAGATIQLYVAGNTGYYSNATPLLTHPVTSDSNGNFSISNDYTCSPGNALVYLTATGGNAGSGNNSAIALMLALGPCSSLTSTTGPLIINEVSTVVAAFTMQQYGKTYTAIGSSSTTLGVQGLTNAMALANTLAPMTLGQASASLYGGVVKSPVSQINQLANVLAACVNANPSSNTACSTLFSNAVSPEGTTPTDTATAAFNIARNPAATATAALAGLAGATPPFQPSATATPNDWTLVLWFGTASGTGNPGTQGTNSNTEIWGQGIDGAGNFWIPQYGYGGLFILSPNGSYKYLYPSTITVGGTSYTFGRTSSMAFDLSGNAWILDRQRSNLFKLAPDGTALARFAAPYGPNAVGFTPNGTLWMQTGTSLYGYDSSFNPIQGSPFTLPSSITTDTLVADASGNLWVSPYQGTTVYKVTPGAGSISTASYTSSLISLYETYGAAIDHAGNAWWVGIVEMNSNGTVLNSTRYTGGGYSATTTSDGVAIDGDGNVWARGCGSNLCASKFNSAGVAQTPSTGFGYTAGVSAVGDTGPMIDGSGNLYFNASSFGVYIMVGVAAPVVTPAVTAAATNQLGVRP